MSTEVKKTYYHTVPLANLPPEEALDFCKRLYHPQERFAQGFFRYWADVLELPEDVAWQATLDECEASLEALTENLADPYTHTIGFTDQGTYTPIGLYGFRPLEEHPVGKKIHQVLMDKEVLAHYPEKLAIAHTFSALNGYRNRVLMKYAFLLIALEAVEKGFSSIFFFMSDYRLGPIYERLGLQFPDYLTFPDSKHLVGCYMISARTLEDIKAVRLQFQESLDEHRLAIPLG